MKRNSNSNFGQQCDQDFFHTPINANNIIIVKHKHICNGRGFSAVTAPANVTAHNLTTHNLIQTQHITTQRRCAGRNATIRDIHIGEFVRRRHINNWHV